MLPYYYSFFVSRRSLIFLIDPGGSPVRFLLSCDFDKPINSLQLYVVISLVSLLSGALGYKLIKLGVGVITIRLARHILMIMLRNKCISFTQGAIMQTNTN